MEFIKLSSNEYLLRFEKGLELISQLLDFMKKMGFKTGFFYGIGAASKCLIGRYNQNKKGYDWKKIEKQMEVLALIGNITKKEEDLFCHTHLALGDNKFRSWGGHLKELYVNPTMEIYLKVFKKGVGRFFDSKTRLHLIKGRKFARGN